MSAPKNQKSPPSRPATPQSTARPSPQLRNDIPEIYGKILPEEFLAQSSHEPLATCDDCRMCKPRFTHPQETYSPNTKCCTFYPFVPNYLVGGALAAGGEGAVRIKALIRRREWTLPIGIVAPPSYQMRFNDKRPEEFGRNLDYLCPFYQGGKCSIWRFRNSDCSTYFCAHSENEIGKQRWLDIGAELFATEMTLTQECMLEKGYSWPEVESLLRFIKFTVHASDKIEEYAKYEIDALKWSGFWQHRGDDPEAFYRECYEWVGLRGQSLLQTSHEHHSRI